MPCARSEKEKIFRRFHALFSFFSLWWNGKLLTVEGIFSFFTLCERISLSILILRERKFHENIALVLTSSLFPLSQHSTAAVGDLRLFEFFQITWICFATNKTRAAGVEGGNEWISWNFSSPFSHSYSHLPSALQHSIARRWDVIVEGGLGERAGGEGREN